MPYKSSIPLSWRLNRSRYRLVGTECSECKEIFFPPRSMCPNCRRKGRTKEIQLSGEGKIYTYTIIHAAPSGFEGNVPYVVGIIKLKEGVMVTGQIVPPFENISIGKGVNMIFRRVSEDGATGIINYGFKFRITE